MNSCVCFGAQQTWKWGLDTHLASCLKSGSITLTNSDGSMTSRISSSSFRNITSFGLCVFGQYFRRAITTWTKKTLRVNHTSPFNKGFWKKPLLHLFAQKHLQLKQLFSMWICVKLIYFCIFSIITPVFSVTWSSEIIIICSRNISDYYQCWKQSIFLWKLWYI